MAIDATDAAKMRIGAVGVSVDTTLDPATLATNWTSTGGQANRNTLNTAERIITRAINALDGDITNAKISTDAFAARFDAVVGNETGADQTAFDALGGNLIQAVHGLVTAPSGGGGDATSIQGRDVVATAPTDGQALAWNQTADAWIPTTIAGGDGNATQIQNRNVAAAAPTDGQALAWSQTTNQWLPTTITGGGDATSIQGRNVTSSAPTDGQALAWSQSASQWVPTTITDGGSPTGDLSVNSIEVTGQGPNTWGLNVYNDAQISGHLSVIGNVGFHGSNFNFYTSGPNWWQTQLSILSPLMYISGGELRITSELHSSGGMRVSGSDIRISGNDVRFSPYEMYCSGQYTYFTGGSVSFYPNTLSISGNQTYISGGSVNMSPSFLNIRPGELRVSGGDAYISGRSVHVTAPIWISGYPGMTLTPGNWSNYYGYVGLAGSIFTAEKSRHGVSWSSYIYMSGQNIGICPQRLSLSGQEMFISGGDLRISSATRISGNDLGISSYYTYLSGQYTYFNGGSVGMYPSRLSISGGETYISGGDLRITSRIYISGGHYAMQLQPDSSSYPFYNYGEFSVCGSIFSAYRYGRWTPPSYHYSGIYMSGREINICPWGQLCISGNVTYISGGDLRITSETYISGGNHFGIRSPTYISGGYGFWCYDDAVFGGEATFAGSRVAIFRTWNGPGGARMTIAGGYDSPVLEVSSAYATAIRAYAWRDTAISAHGEQGTAIYVTEGGVLKPGGGSWSATSDARTKTDVKKYETGLKELVQLEPISFRYNGRGRIRETGKRFVGLAAEAVEPVMPEIVHTMKGKLEYDDEEETDIRMIDPSNLTYATINAFKDISQTLKRIDERLTALEEKSKDK